MFAARLLAFLVLLWRPAFADDPPLRIVNAKDPDGLAISTLSAKFDYLIFIENRTSTAVKGLEIELPPLAGPDSAQVNTTWEIVGAPVNPQSHLPAPIALAGLKAARLHVVADVSMAGPYTSAISLKYGGKRYTTPLKITRASNVPTVAATFNPVALANFSNVRSARFSLKETAGVKVRLRVPGLLGLTRKDSDKSLAFPYDAAAFFLEKPDGTSEPVKAGVDIPENSAANLRLDLSGLGESGEYAASIHIASADGALPPQTLTFFVKRTWLCAALCIGLGVLISWFIRRRTKTDRPRMVLQRRVLVLKGDVYAQADKLRDPMDQELLNCLADRLDRLYEDVTLGFADNPDAALTNVDAKLSLVPYWSILRRRIDAVQPPIAAVENVPTATLANARALICSAAVTPAQQITDTGQALRTAVDTVNNAVSADLLQKTASARAAAQAAANGLSPARKTEFDQQVTAILNRAEAAARQNPPDVDEARGFTEQARRAYAAILARDLAEKVAAIHRPASVTEAEWNDLQEHFNRSSAAAQNPQSGDTATLAYQEVYVYYLRILIRVAQADATRLLADATAAANNANINRLNTAINTLATAGTRLDQGEADAAKESYDQARAQIEQAATEQPSAKIMEFRPGHQQPPQRDQLSTASGILSIPGLASAFQADSVATRQNHTWRDIDAVTRAIRQRDAQVAWMVAAVAVLLGVYLLWVDNLTWGSPKDMMAAFLWGLGLHQVAGNSALASLSADQIAGPAGAQPNPGGNNAAA